MEDELINWIIAQKEKTILNIPKELIVEDLNNEDNRLSKIYSDGMIKAYDLIISKIKYCN